MLRDFAKTFSMHGILAMVFAFAPTNALSNATAVPTPLVVCTVMDLGFNEWTQLGESGKRSDFREQGVQPFEDGTDVTGFDSRMRNLILCASMGLSYELKVLQSYPEIIEKTASKECDIGFAPVTLMSSREGCTPNCTGCCVDFSHPYFPGSVGYMYKRSVVASRRSVRKALVSPSVLNVVNMFIILVTLSGHIIW
jgi:hypothetical protein